MKTGFVLGATPENYFPETFFIIYLVLAAILRRCGFKDCVLYSLHSKRVFNQEMFDAGVIFNLYSEYGVGKSLKPLLIELFSTIGLDPEKNRFNVFFQEIVRLTPVAVNIVRSKDPIIETSWMMKYAMEMEPVKDDIANERILRMADLLYDIPSSEEEDIYTDSEEDSYTSDTDEYDIDTEEIDDEIKEIDDEIKEIDDDIVITDNNDDIVITDNNNDIVITDNNNDIVITDNSNSDGSDINLNSNSNSNSDNDNDGSDNDGSDNDNDGSDSNSSSDGSDGSSSDGVICYCLFCHEFRKYYGTYKDQNVTDMIIDTLMNITAEISRGNQDYRKYQNY